MGLEHGLDSSVYKILDIRTSSTITLSQILETKARFSDIRYTLSRKRQQQQTKSGKYYNIKKFKHFMIKTDWTD